MIYNIYCYYKILRVCIAIISLLYYFTIYYPLRTIILLLLTETIILLLLKTIAIIQPLLLLLNLLFKNYIWIECGGEKASDGAVRTDQLIKEQSFQNRLDW